MFTIYNKQYNPKIDFKFLYSINPKLNLKENYVEIREIFKHNMQPISEQGKMFFALQTIYQYLKKTQFKQIKMNEFQILLQFLNETLSQIEQQRLKKILNTFQKEDVLQSAVTLLCEIYQERIFHCDVLAYLFFNAFLIKNNYVPMVFFRKQIDFINKMMDSHITIESLYTILDSIRDLSIKYLNQYEICNKKEIIDRILQYKEILKKEYHVKQFWLYGSFVRDEATCYSDVDCLIESDSYIEYQPLEEYLMTILKRPVDIQIVGHYNPRYTFEIVLQEKELIF